jgi:hypothetical protein
MLDLIGIKSVEKLVIHLLRYLKKKEGKIKYFFNLKRFSNRNEKKGELGGLTPLMIYVNVHRGYEN